MEKYWQSAILPGMAWMIGIDEAGYGPTLGPLAVAATVWRIQDSGVRGQGSEVSRSRSDRASVLDTPFEGGRHARRVAKLA